MKCLKWTENQIKQHERQYILLLWYSFIKGLRTLHGQKRPLRIIYNHSVQVLPVYTIIRKVLLGLLGQIINIFTKLRKRFINVLQTYHTKSMQRVRIQNLKEINLKLHVFTSKSTYDAQEACIYFVTRYINTLKQIAYKRTMK